LRAQRGRVVADEFREPPRTLVLEKPVVVLGWVDDVRIDQPEEVLEGVVFLPGAMTPAGAEPDNASFPVMPGRPAVIVTAAEPGEGPVVAATPDLAGTDRLLRALVHERPNYLVPVQILESDSPVEVVEIGRPLVQIVKVAPGRTRRQCALTPLYVSRGRSGSL
jgi:hypothetical protein